MGRSDLPFRSQIVASIGEVEALVAERKIRGAVFAYREGEAVPIVERLNPTKVRKQDFHNGEQVMIFERTMLIYKRGHSPEDAAGY